LTRGKMKVRVAGVVQGTVLASGVRGESLRFQRAGDCVDLPELDFGERVTVALWVKPQAKQDMRTILANKRPGATENGFALFFNNRMTSDGTARIEAGDGTASIVSAGMLDRGIAEDRWQHVAFTLALNTGSYSIYVDGIQRVVSGARGTYRTKGVWRLGGHLADPQFGFRGEMDDLMIFDSYLTGAEIKKLASLPKTAR
jgi:hypothetical protein